MTYPNFPFPPGTPLYPSHEHVQAYHESYARHYDLLPHIRFHHTVLSTKWVGSPDEGFWNITVIDHRNRTLRATADHLIVASGNNHIPRIPTWKGQEKWLDSEKYGPFPREILHSVYYREPERYRNRTLLIIGAGASGQDAGVQTVQYARRVRLLLCDLAPVHERFCRRLISLQDATLTFHQEAKKSSSNQKYHTLQGILSSSSMARS